MIRVVIVAGIRLYRDGLATLIQTQDGLCVAGTYSDSLPSADDLRQLAPDVVLVDLATAGSHDAIRRLKAACASLPIVAIGIVDGDAEVLACAEAGAIGYVTREGSLAELVAAVRCSVNGELMCTPRVAGTLVRRLAKLSVEHHVALKESRLSRREWEVAALIGERLSNKEIAVRLGIEVATVKNHVHNLLQKLDVQCREDAGRAARMLSGLTQPVTLPH
jgi:two-component system, NarL family, nitrate/nitrite response regulator NarL